MPPGARARNKEGIWDVLSQRGISKASGKLILDHAEGRGSDVTEVHYNLDPRLPEKESVMHAWVEFLDRCVSMVRRSADLQSEQSKDQVRVAENESRCGVPELAVCHSNFNYELNEAVMQNELRSVPGLNSPTSEDRHIDADRLQRLRKNLSARLRLEAIEHARGRGVSNE